MTEQGYLRQPTISDDTVVFVCDDDLWTVPRAGGVARRLTAGVGEPTTPALSRDGQLLAYVSRDEHHPEVYLMPARGGAARRMTWLGPDVMVRGFTPDGKILLVTTHGQPFFRNYRAYTLAIDGGLPELLPLGQVNHLAFGPAGAMVLGRNTADPARWKRYRGGTAGHLWVDAKGQGEFVRLSALRGNITSPMWIGERIYFLSDAEGIGNLYSCRPDGSALERHTEHAEFYARHAQTDGRRIVYQCAAEIWIYEPGHGAAKRIDIEVPAHRAQAARRFVAAGKFLAGVRPHPQGHSLAFEARGRTYTAGFWDGAVVEHGDEGSSRQRLGQWLADGTTLIAVSDASGEERVVVYEGREERSLPWDVGRVLAMQAAPVGTRVAITNHRHEVLLGDVASGAIEVVDRSPASRTEELAWSPDGQWLAYPFWTTFRHCAIKLYSLASKVATAATRAEFRDYAPAFDPEGKYLYFLSVRTFDPVYDAVQFELSFPRAARPYAIALSATAPHPFQPEPRPFADDKGARPPETGVPAGPAPVVVDLNGLADRVAAFPVPEGRFGQLAAARGKVFWTALPIQGAHGRGGHQDAHGRLEAFDFELQTAETWVERVDSFALSEDRSVLALRIDDRVRVIDARRKPEPKADAARESDGPSRKSGWIDLERLRVSVEPRREWAQMFREVWRLQRDQFWVPDMSGVDWDGIYRQYQPLLSKVATRSELSDLIWELHGELGTSHAYEMGGDHRAPPRVALGQLAADFRPSADGTGFEVAHIVRGDAWDAASDSPLNGIAAQVRVGERVVAINGRDVTRERPPQALLVHQANQKVEIALAGEDGAVRRITVKALEDETPARYRSWVENNRHWVHEASAGKIGYLHLPDMQSAGFAEFHRYFLAECDRPGLIVDVRYNRGGHVSQLLLEKVARKRLGYDLQRWGQPMPYPSESPAGAVLALTNEHAGSDGDIFSHCFKLMGLGPLVGKRTWGGVIGIWPRHALIDGTETTQPEFSFWFKDVGWGVENYGTDPDIDVDNAPQDARAGRDRQLEVALQTILEAVGKGAGLAPEFGPRPVLARRFAPGA